MEERETKILLSAAERRERRMKQILGNSEERLSKILSGPNGEKRLAPALEGGGSLFNLPSIETETVSTREACTDGRTLNEGSAFWTFTPVLRVSLLSKWRFQLAVIIGICTRLMVLYGFERNIILPWIIIFTIFELLFSNDRNESSLSDKLMPFILVFQGSEKLLKNTYYAFAVLRVFVNETMALISGFLLTHTFLLLIDGL